MKNSELLKDFLDKVVSGDSDGAKDAFSLYCNNKAKAVALRENAVRSANVVLFAALLKEFNGQGVEPLDMDGDKILINGKPVGRVSTEYKIDDNGITDIEGDNAGGINFTSIEGNFSKEFDDMNQLTAWLRQRYLGEK